ncbi:hypothetical protein [Candidatus Chloroploca asiatica]|nr:hypothetical protein [Candidatus Chloroploca asiatica]
MKDASLIRQQARRLFWAMEDVVYGFLLRRGSARDEERLDLHSSPVPPRARQADATRRRGSRWVDSLCPLPLMSLGLLLALLVGASLFRPIDR